MAGIPCVAAASRYTAPVHIDVGGTIYTSSLETLTKFPESRLAKMFNGTIPIVLDSLKQHYFIDRDGKMFRHILNFMRNSRLVLPEGFDEVDILLEEANFFEIPRESPLHRAFSVCSTMMKQLEEYKKQQRGRSLKMEGVGVANEKNGTHKGSSLLHQRSTSSSDLSTSGPGEGIECVALNICPDLGERVMLSGERLILEEIFPEIGQALLDARQSVAWNQDARHVIRFPLNGYCKINSIQAIKRLLGAGFRIVASSGGGVEGQQFSEYLFCRKSTPL
ncbi:unnamed protein product [Darwinula stevensoni]|uniref:BTB domain-containing protein n=1 Tax=Darwinula stevensoni TaxID=69355 RepID=A0A7R9A459_9CRUS|nr:unnamed protein product [Darwinula stevensoni]CAG0889307.1 unnamed protein product [Darwinula stevensoni]